MSPTEISDFVPVTKWPTLEQLAEGYSDHLMPESGKLAGTLITLTIDNDLRSRMRGDQAGLSGESDYAAFEVRTGFFLVNFYKPDYEEEVSIMLYTATGQVAVAISGFVIEKGKKRTWTKLCTAFAEGSSVTEPFSVTEELIGKYIMYRYTPRDVYEHVYLNRGTLTRHCLSGTEKGLADTERCKALKLDERLYLLFWTETIMPVESIIVVDLEKLRSTGRFFCWDPKPQRAVRMRFGSYATILVETSPATALADCWFVRQDGFSYLRGHY